MNATIPSSSATTMSNVPMINSQMNPQETGPVQVEPFTTAQPLFDVALSDEAKAAVEELAQFMINRAPKVMVELVASCAVDGCQRWKFFFQQGLAEAIAEDPEIENEFFQRLCGGRGLPHTAQIIEAYLLSLGPDRRAQLLSMASLKRKSHPVNLAFTGASFANTPGMTYLMDVLKVFIKYGIDAEKMAFVVSRCSGDMERACCIAHEEFMRLIVPAMGGMNAQLAEAIVSKSASAERVIDFLLRECGVPLSAFTDPRVLSQAKPSAQQFLMALDARSRREPERVLKTADEDF